MTLRITIEIVPLGDEANRRVLEVVDVENVGGPDDACDYRVCRRVFERGERLLLAEDAELKGHDRSEGFWPLVRRVARLFG